MVTAGACPAAWSRARTGRIPCGVEVREEACATVTGCRLLGFSRGVCVRGSQAGLVLVRALWRAQVRPDPWQPRFEIVGRRLVPVAEAFDSLWIEEGFGPLYRRIFVEAALPVRP